MTTALAAAPGVRRLRTTAMVALATHPELPPATLSSLRGTHVRSSSGGVIHLRIPRIQALLVIRLDPAQQLALFTYLEAARLWSEPKLLFPRPGAIRLARWRARRSVR